jgi:hypothetical protein
MWSTVRAQRSPGLFARIPSFAPWGVLEKPAAQACTLPFKALAWALAWVLASAISSGCYSSPPGVIPAPDPELFRSEAYPILLRDCGFVECHGRTERSYRIYGPGRLRLNSTTELLDDVTSAELFESYDSARGMLLHHGDILDSPLLRKPLEGAGHAGLDARGRNVYSSPDDPDYQALVAWAVSDPAGGNLASAGQSTVDDGESGDGSADEGGSATGSAGDDGSSDGGSSGGRGG